MWPFRVLLGLLLMVLGGCALSNAVEEMKGNDELTFFQAMQHATMADLDQAEADAHATGDIIAETCYTTLKKYVGKPLPGKPEIKGVFSAFQSARGLKSKVDTGIPADLRLGCAALVQDVRLFVIKMAAIATGAGAAAGGVIITPPIVPVASMP